MARTDSTGTVNDSPDVSDLLSARFAAVADKLAGLIEEPLRVQHGLPMKDWKVMQSLAVHGALPPNEIHKLSGQSKAQISRALGCLLERELVAKAPHPEDNRTFVVSLTADGKRMYLSIIKQMRRKQADFLNGLTKTEARRLQQVIDGLEKSISD